MPPIPDRWLRLLGAIVFTLLLGACGPGTGGTGTGPGPTLVLTFGGNSSVSVAAPGAACAAAGCDRIDLRLEDAQVTVQADCRRFVATGPWSPDVNGVVTLAGTIDVTTAAGVASQPATLRLQFSEKVANSAQVTLVVTDAAGRTLVGPATLNRGDAAAALAAGACSAVR